MGRRGLPDDFEVSQTMRDWAKTKVPEVDVDAATEEFRDYYLANGRQMANWIAAWRNWLRRALHFNNNVRRKEPEWAPPEESDVRH